MIKTQNIGYILALLFFHVYNDFIILYCCGLEKNTYNGITSRLYKEEIIDIDENEKDWDKISIDSYTYKLEQNENIELAEIST